ncbi:MAG TPA: dTMP kinase [Candidatus Dormibacteraeota bacterium]|nr:dTMP kinase [Candidatus Dormibacteraeota bacterium]
MALSRRPGFFVSFEGVDGSGKSTQMAAAAAAIRHTAHVGDVVMVREPGDTALGELARAFLLQHQLVTPIDPWAEALVFMAARAQLLREVITPALERGAVVLTDRFVDSTLAYQGGGRGLPDSVLRAIHRETSGDLWPDLTVLLDLPLEVARARRHAQELPLDRMEATPEQFQWAVHDTFRRIAEAEPSRVRVVDASRSAVAVSEEVVGLVVAGLTEHRAAATASPAVAGRS